MNSATVSERLGAPEQADRDAWLGAADAVLRRVVRLAAGARELFCRERPDDGGVQGELSLQRLAHGVVPPCASTAGSAPDRA